MTDNKHLTEAIETLLSAIAQTPGARNSKVLMEAVVDANTAREYETRLRWITDHINEERLAYKHVEAIATIVCFMNWSKESEQDILSFAKHLKEKYKGYIITR